MILIYALAILALGAVKVKAQETDVVSDNYYSYGYTSWSSKTSMFWTATLRYQDWVSTSTYTFAGETTTYLATSTRVIKSTVTPTATPTYTSTYPSRYDNVLVIELYYPRNAVAESDFVSTSTTETTVSATSARTYSTTAYLMPVVMTAPSSCSTVFTVATQASITYMPTIILDQLKPTSTEVSTDTIRSYVAEYNTWYLTAGAAPFTSTDDFYYSYYIASCTPPPAQYTGGTRNPGGGNPWNGYRTCYLFGCVSLKIWIIIIATVLPGIFLLGFLESWIWYTRLMKGKSTMRCGTVCWMLLCLLVMCFTRFQNGRSTEDQKVLQQKWKEMSAGQKFKNWSWGFKRSYPVPLLGQYSPQTVGIVPEGQPLHPALAQVYYGPPPPNGVTPGYPMPTQGSLHYGGYYATNSNAPKEGITNNSPSAAPPAPGPINPPPINPPPNNQMPTRPQQSVPSNMSEVLAASPTTTQPQAQPTNHESEKDTSDLYK